MTNTQPQVVESASASTAPQTNSSNLAYAIVAIALGVVLLICVGLGLTAASVAYAIFGYTYMPYDEVLIYDDYSEEELSYDTSYEWSGDDASIIA